MMDRVFYAGCAMGHKVRGRALVAKDGFYERYDLDRLKGIFSRPEHALTGQSYQERILILDAAKGGVATAWMLFEMASREMIPLALVLNRANPIMAQGAAHAGLPLMSDFDCNITSVVPSGALVELDPGAERPYLKLLSNS